MNSSYVWGKIFPFTCEYIERAGKIPQLHNICDWIARAYNEKELNRNETGNLMRRIRSDYRNNWEYWTFISNSSDYEDFLKNIPEYTKIRQKFPSRDKEPLEEICFPWSNEKLYGKGINSRVRQDE